MKVQNISAAAIVIDGKDVIAPLATYEFDGEHKGIAQLIEVGKLREVTEAAENAQKPKSKSAPKTE